MPSHLSHHLLRLSILQYIFISSTNLHCPPSLHFPALLPPQYHIYKGISRLINQNLSSCVLNVIVRLPLLFSVNIANIVDSYNMKLFLLLGLLFWTLAAAAPISGPISTLNTTIASVESLPFYSDSVHSITGIYSNITIVDHRKGESPKMCNPKYGALYFWLPIPSYSREYHRKTCEKAKQGLEDKTKASP